MLRKKQKTVKPIPVSKTKPKGSRLNPNNPILSKLISNLTTSEYLNNAAASLNAKSGFDLFTFAVSIPKIGYCFLPPEIMERIFEYFLPEESVKLGAVNRFFYGLSRSPWFDNVFWKRLALHHFPMARLLEAEANQSNYDWFLRFASLYQSTYELNKENSALSKTHLQIVSGFKAGHYDFLKMMWRLSDTEIEARFIKKILNLSDSEKERKERFEAFKGTVAWSDEQGVSIEKLQNGVPLENLRGEFPFVNDKANLFDDLFAWAMMQSKGNFFGLDSFYQCGKAVMDNIIKKTGQNGNLPLHEFAMLCCQPESEILNLNALYGISPASLPGVAYVKNKVALGVSRDLFSLATTVLHYPSIVRELYNSNFLVGTLPANVLPTPSSMIFFNLLFSALSSPYYLVDGLKRVSQVFNSLREKNPDLHVDKSILANGNQLLEKVVKYGGLETVTYLLDKKEPEDVLKYGDLEAVTYLLDKTELGVLQTLLDAAILTKVPEGISGDLYVLYEQKNKSIMKYLLKYIEEFFPLNATETYNTILTIRDSIPFATLDFFFANLPEKVWGRFSFLEAIITSHKQVSLLEHFKKNKDGMNITDLATGDTLLHRVAAIVKLDMVDPLIKRGCDPSKKNKKGETALDCLASSILNNDSIQRRGHKKIVTAWRALCQSQSIDTMFSALSILLEPYQLNPGLNHEHRVSLWVKLYQTHKVESELSSLYSDKLTTREAYNVKTYLRTLLDEIYFPTFKTLEGLIKQVLPFVVEGERFFTSNESFSLFAPSSIISMTNGALSQQQQGAALFNQKKEEFDKAEEKTGFSEKDIEYMKDMEIDTEEFFFYDEEQGEKQGMNDQLIPRYQ